MSVRAAAPIRRDTIVGVATGSPDGGVAIVRVSGSKAEAVGVALCGSVGEARHLAFRRLVLGDDQTAEAILAAWMPGPRSFTGEDVLELHIHAGARNVRRVLEACLNAGCVAAGPGDFTRRAFENGKISLDQAEGIAALIGAQTDAALDQAKRLVAGDLGREVEALRESLIRLRTEVEANLDFPEDVSAGDEMRWAKETEEVRGRLLQWLAGFEAGRRARERLRIVIAGPVNAGKSTLFNALLGRDRAIVADVPGTTRDYVEAEWDVGPYGAWLVDTAGLRDSDEAIEAEGINRSREQIESADLVLWVESATEDDDSNRPPTNGPPVLWIESKRDCGSQRLDWLGVRSDDEGQSIKALRSQVQTWFRGDQPTAWIGLARHRGRAEEAVEELHRAHMGLLIEAPLETVAFELSIAERRLGEITGRTALGPVGEDVLDRIFSEFCIGK